MFFPRVVVVLTFSSSLSVVARIRAQRSAPSGWWRSRRTRSPFSEHHGWLFVFRVAQATMAGQTDKSAQRHGLNDQRKQSPRRRMKYEREKTKTGTEEMSQTEERGAGASAALSGVSERSREWVKRRSRRGPRRRAASRVLYGKRRWRRSLKV